MKRGIIALSVGLACLLAVLIAWDFSKLGRHIPLLVATDTRATLIVVEKQARRLTLFRDDKIIKTYHVALGGHPIGPKQQEGDGRTPEGDYMIDSKNGHSRAHLALHVSYPGVDDRTRAARLGASPGGDIMIHGLFNGFGWLGGLHRFHDWTNGCIAVTNAEIEEIWSLVEPGTKIQIKP